MLEEQENKSGFYEKEFRVDFTQVGFRGCLTNKSILDMFQRTADSHSIYYHNSFEDLAKDNLAWVILNWKLQVFKRPKDNDKVKVITWGRFFNKLFVLRDFKMFDEFGNLCAIATSKWCFIDVNSHRLARMYDDLDKRYGSFEEESVFGIGDLPRLDLPSESEHVVNELNYHIRRFDIDINRHVHNLDYLDFAYEVLPEEVYFDEPELNNVEISYKKEISIDEDINIELYESEDNDISLREKNEIEYQKLSTDEVFTVLIKNHDKTLLHSIIKLYN